MKKLMIAAAIVCAAAMSQAATTYWGFTATAAFKAGYGKDGKSYTPVALSGATLYLLSVADSGYTTQDALYQDLMGGKTTIEAIKASALASGTTDSAGKITSRVDFSREDATVGSTYYYALFGASDDGKYVYFSASKNAVAQADPAVATFSPAAGTSANFKDSETVTAGGWYAAAVPEPTSGLRLLLGVAGLALRRRRA